VSCTRFSWEAGGRRLVTTVLMLMDSIEDPTDDAVRRSIILSDLIPSDPVMA
jgi:hypothetical protein